MAKRIQVGGRIESKEVGGIVTGAAEILDDAKGKKQSVINGETDDELVRLDQSKQDNLTFDNAPTEGSDNPVKSGGVYAADKALSDAIEAILLLIPSAASALNKLVDTAMMNSSISTATATFRGTYNVVTDLELAVDATHEQIAAALGNVISTADNNDYAFVQVPVSAESMDIRRTERYKFNGTAWGYEYDLNTSGFTAAQWAAINSGITIALVGKLIGLPTSLELMALLGQKQDTLTFDNIPTSGSANPVKSGGVYSAINDEKTAREQLAQTVTGINGRLGNVDEVIPTGAAANNKLVANNSMEAYVTSLIEAITASFTITTADGHINFTLTQTNGRVASLTLTSSDIASAQALTALTGRVSTAENNITTINSNITSLGGRVSTNETDIANLRQLYNDLQQSKPEPVTALPETGQQQGVIYRLAGTTSYSDYMWNGTTWVLMATYNNAIDDVPTAGSDNMCKSGGIFKSNYKFTQLEPTTSTDNSAIRVSDGVIETSAQYMGTGLVCEYAIQQNKLYQIFAAYPNFNAGYAVATLYKNGELTKVLRSCNSSYSIAQLSFFNNLGADTLKVCFSKRTSDLYARSVICSDIINTNSVCYSPLHYSNVTVAAGIKKSSGEVVTGSSYNGAAVTEYSIKNDQLIKILFESPGYDSSYSLVAIYKDGNYIKSLIDSETVVEEKELCFYNNFNADTLRICSRKGGSTGKIEWPSVHAADIIHNEDIQIVGEIEKTISYTNQNHKSFSNLAIGDTFSTSDDNYRAIAEIPVTHLSGKVKITNVLNTGEFAVAVVNSNNIIVDLQCYMANGELQNVLINLDKYVNGIYKADKIYAMRGPVEYTVLDAPVVTNYFDGLNQRVDSLEKINQTSGVLLLHLDVVPEPNMLIMQLLEEYGFNASWYLNSYACSDDDTFESPWTGDYGAGISKALKRGDDLALYPRNKNAGSLNEAGWKEYILAALSGLEGKGLYNITTFACGQLAINNDLYNAAKDCGFKIIRGGNDPNPEVVPYNTYPYTDDNIWMSLKNTNDTFIVNSTIQLSDSQNMQRLFYRINYAIASGTAVSIFMHNDVSETNMRTFFDFVKSLVDSGKLKIMTWREYYASVNRVDGHEWDYNRLLKIQLNA